MTALGGRGKKKKEKGLVQTKVTPNFVVLHPCSQIRASYAGKAREEKGDLLEK